MNGIIKISDKEQKISLALKNIKDLDLGNLLNEDLERSRNTVLKATAVFFFFSIFDIKKLEFLGLRAEVAATQQGIILIFLFILTVVLCVYYHVNAKAEFTAKGAARAEARMRLRQHSRDFASEIINIEKTLATHRKNQAKKVGNQNTLKYENDPEDLERLAKQEMAVIVDVYSRFEKQLKTSNRSHYVIMISCIVAEMAVAANIYRDELAAFIT